MNFHLESIHLESIRVFVTECFEDSRGFFMESFRHDQWKLCEMTENFVQDNHSGSKKGVLRGLHFQWSPPMGKLMRVSRGKAYLVAVDIRKKSPYLGKYFGIEVSDENHRQVWAPSGFARGFLVLSDWAEIQYKCTAIYNPKGESAIRWNDPEIGIDWPSFSSSLSLSSFSHPILSEKDQQAQSLSTWLAKTESDSLIYENPIQKNSKKLFSDSTKRES